jgi:hypothetical protein
LLAFPIFSGYNFSMNKRRPRGRPPIPPELRMDTDLRIPLTREQKAVIDEATADEPEGKAGWARDILLRAAARKLAKRGGSATG